MKIKALLYCCKAKPYLYPHFHNLYFTKNKDFGNVKLNGKIVAECDFEVEEIIYNYVGNPLDDFYGMQLLTKTLKESEILQHSKLKFNELRKYLLRNEDDYISPLEVGHAIHIKNLNIFDKPKELNEVYKIEDVGGMLFTKPLTKAPQNMMRVSVNHWDYATYNPDDIRILISIQSQWMCLILNHIKDVEVRRVVLKEMLNNE